MCNEVGEETCRFREVLGGLVWDSEHELEPIFILDGLDENGALFIPRFVRKLGSSECTSPPLVGPWSRGHP